MLFLPSRAWTFFAVSSLFLCSVIHSQQVGEFKSVQATSTASYPNDPNGLRQLLEEMLVAARQNDNTKLQSLIRETEIPSYENSFTTT